VPSKQAKPKTPSFVHGTPVEAGWPVFSPHREGQRGKTKEKMHYLEETCDGEQHGRHRPRHRELTGTRCVCSAQASIIPTNLYVTTLVEMPLYSKHPGNKIMPSRSGGASLLRAR